MSKATPVPLPPLSKSKKVKSSSTPLAKLSDKVSKAAKSFARPTPTKTSKQKAKPQLSEELVVDSSDEDAAPVVPVTNGVKNSKPAAAQSNPNGVTSKTVDTTSSDEESEEDDSEVEAEEQVVEDTTTAISKEISEAALETEAQPLPALKELIPPSDKHRTAALRPVHPFEPPKGYRDVSDGAHTKHVKLLDRTNLAGKQLWYISAPAALNLSKIQELSLEQLKGKKPVLEQDGGEYALQAQDQDTDHAVQVMLPREKDYAPISSKILMQYRLQHRVKLPDPTVAKQAYSKTKREQPTGMRTRWRPAGAKRLEDEDSDVEIVANTSLLDQHTITMQDSPRKKRKQKDEDTNDKAERKKEEKRKKERAVEAVSNPAEEPANRSGFDRSTPELLRLRDELKGAPAAPQSQEKQKKKKKKNHVDAEGDTSMVDAPPAGAVVEATPRKHSGKKNSVIPSDMIHPPGEVRKERKKKREKDKSSARELMEATNI